MGEAAELVLIIGPLSPEKQQEWDETDSGRCEATEVVDAHLTNN